MKLLSPLDTGEWVFKGAFLAFAISTKSSNTDLCGY